MPIAASPSLRGAIRAVIGRVARAAATPFTPDDYLELVSPLLIGTALRGRVVSVARETRDARTLVIRPGRGWRGHTPGQHVRVGVDVDGVRHWRTYSLTSGDGRHIAITVKALPGGLVSSHLVHAVRPGTVVRLARAEGDFVLPAPVPKQVLFVTAGSGITPVMGMLSSGALDGSDVVLVHSARDEQDVIFGRRLRAWADHGWLRLVERHTAAEGRLSPDGLAALVPDLAGRQVWACGPQSLLDDLQAAWPGLGPADALHIERFSASRVAAGQGGTVTFDRSGASVEADGATSLLEAGEAAGVLLPHGCRMGICFGCVVPLRDGSVRDLRDGTLTTADGGDGVLVQTCVSAAAGPCRIDC